MTREQLGDVDPDEEDRRLLDLHIQGDRDAFGQLAARHYQRLWPVALRMCRDQQRAEDALQDAMISAMRNAGSFRGDARVTTWLHRIVVNSSLDQLRKAKRVTTVELPDDSGPGALQDSVDRLSQRELHVEVEAALGRLPADQRAAVLLVDVQGYSVAEASAILQIPEGTVKSRSYRARARLAEHLTHLRNQNGSGNVEHTESPGTGPSVPRGRTSQPKGRDTGPDTAEEEGQR